MSAKYQNEWKRIMKDKIYKDLDKLPSGRADSSITDGCLVLEGGGWKGLYTVGVLDCMMLNGINISSVIGVSAGALSSVGYISGQIGWSARIDLTYRHDINYCGLGAVLRDHGVTGFTYLFNDITKALPLDEERLMSPDRKLAVTATNLLTGKITYFQKGKCDLFRAIQASATVPYVSMPVMIDGVPYLDGGCAEKIPFSRVERSGRDKVVVVRTRELSYRRKPGASRLARICYGNTRISCGALKPRTGISMPPQTVSSRERGTVRCSLSRPRSLSQYQGLTEIWISSERFTGWDFTIWNAELMNLRDISECQCDLTGAFIHKIKKPVYLP